MESVPLNTNEKKINASEKAYQKIKEIILSGEASPGQQLKEAALSQALDLTRTPVREALKKLEAQDMVQVIPNRGAFVSSFSDRDIFDILDTREALECKATHLACRRANREELDRIRDQLESLKSVVKSDVKTLKLDFNFHYEVVKLSKNKFLISAWELLKNRLDLVRIRSVLSMDKNRLEEAIEANLAILRLITDGESKQAQEKIIEHIGHFKKNLKVL